MDPADPQVVWALTTGGLDRSSDCGQTWETGLSLPGVDGQPVALAVDEGAIWLVTGEPRALYRSADEGDSWERIAGR